MAKSPAKIPNNCRPYYGRLIGYLPIPCNRFSEVMKRTVARLREVLPPGLSMTRTESWACVTWRWYQKLGKFLSIMQIPDLGN